MSEACCSRRRKRWTSAASLGFGALALLAPKCPACIVVWLSALGVGAGVAGAVAPLLRPAAFVLLGGALLLLLLREVARRQRSE